MLEALRAGIDSYQPEHPGLEPETGDPRVSSRNVRRLLEKGYRLSNLIGGAAGVVFCFWKGEQFLALGFRVGERERAFALAGFMAEAGYGRIEPLARFYSSLPGDWEGPIPLKPVE